jgi:hypothetical protein
VWRLWRLWRVEMEFLEMKMMIIIKGEGVAFLPSVPSTIHTFIELN